jgi:pyrroloquinoline-quinone synthase
MFDLLDPAVAIMHISPHRQPSLPLDEVAACSSLDQALLTVAEMYDFQWHPYFLWMRSQSTDRHTFRHSQLPFRYAVEAFSQALAAVLARVPTVEARMALVDNINEEHGRGNPLRSHKATFRQYLQSLGATDVDLEMPISTNVLAFNQSTLNYCLTQSPESGAAMLGAIEYLYVGISTTIARTIADRQWVAHCCQSHYSVHEQLDVEHSRDLLQLAAPAWDNLYQRRQIAQSLLLGAHYFWNLYEGMQP